MNRRKYNQLVKYQDRCERLAGRPTDHVMLPSYLRAFGLSEFRIRERRAMWRQNRSRRRS